MVPLRALRHLIAHMRAAAIQPDADGNLTLAQAEIGFIDGFRFIERAKL